MVSDTYLIPAMNTGPPFLHARRLPARWRYVTGLALLSLCVAGCAPPDPDELAKEVLATDPSFASVLEKRQELANRIDTYQRELALKRSTVEQTIQQMRQDLVASADAVRAKTEETKAKMEPYRKPLTKALAEAREELRAKQAQRAAIGRSISQLRKSLKRSSAASTDEERALQEVHADDMWRDAARIDQEMTAIKSYVRHLKIKLLLITL